jgi:hypothetical protein
MRFLASVAVAGCLSTGILRTAFAVEPGADHLRCYRVSDSSVRVAVLDLDTTLLGVDAGCKVKTAAREICVPTSGDMLPGDFVETEIVGEGLVSERLCYRVKCPKRSRPVLQVSDRFGTRTVSLAKPRAFCTPAEPLADRP